MFKDKIKELRIVNHLTQEQLAEKLFVSRSAVAKWEQGRGIPKYDTVKDIANLFSVPIETFYEQDAAQEVIQVIEKDNKKKIIILFSIIAALLISLTSSLIYAFSKNEFKPYSEYNTFVDTNTLEKLSLQNLKAVNDNNSSRVNYCSKNIIDYYSKINDFYEFLDYSNYILSFLLSSPYISYVGYNSNVIADHSVLLYDEIYLSTSAELEKYIYPGIFDSFYGNKETNMNFEYQFYFLSKLPSSHKERDNIKVSRINLSWSTFNAYTGKLFANEYETDLDYFIGEYNFKLSITKNCYGTYYFYDDYFETKTITINKNNFNDYFYFRVNPSAVVKYAINSNYIFYDAYVEVEVFVGDESYGQKAITIIRSSDVGGGFDIDSLYGYYDDKLQDFVYPYSLDIKEGYISFAIPR